MGGKKEERQERQEEMEMKRSGRATEWAVMTYGSVRLGDERRTQRAVKMASALARDPMASNTAFRPGSASAFCIALIFATASLMDALAFSADSKNVHIVPIHGEDRDAIVTLEIKSGKILRTQGIDIPDFEGVVISRRGNLSGATFTVRRVSFGIGVERIFPVNSPMISSIEILQAGRVRRAKLYYLRALKGKAARIRRAERPAEPATAAAEKS